ncbi:MAG: glycosyltransferase family 4 protein [Thermoproteota archaeon]
MMVGANLESRVEGISNAVREASLELARRGHEIHYLTSAARGFLEEPPDRVIVHEVDVGEAKGYGEKARAFMLKAGVQLRRTAKREEVEVVHCHSSYPAFGAVVGGSGKLKAGKLVSIYSSGKSEAGLGDYPFQTRLALKLFKSRLAVKFDQRFFDKVVAASRGVERDLRKAVPPRKLAFVPVGVDTLTFNPGLDGSGVREELGIGADEKLVLFAGDLAPWKGAEVLLQAVRLARKSVPDLKVLVLSKGTYEFENERKAKLEALIKNLGLEGAASVVGRRKDMPRVYAASDIVALPYLANFALMDVPRSLLEAMASGKPVIASNVGGSSELVEDGGNGFLVRPGSAGELSGRIALLDEKPDLAARLGREARRTVESGYSLCATVEMLDSLYKSLAM